MVLNPAAVAFVTGAGGMVGRHVILQFARDGVRKLAGLDISEAGLTETRRLVKELAPEAEFLPLVADLLKEEEVKTAFASIVTKWGRVDYAVNNAGIGQPLGLTQDTQTSDFERVIGVNLRGVWFCEKLELAQMAAQDPLEIAAADKVDGRVPARGAIVNVDSVLGLLAMPTLGLYTMSKHGLIGLTRTDALDYARKGVRVNGVCPGFIDTPLLIESTRKALAPSIEKTAMGRLANPQEIADAIIFLCSDRASYITGISLPVDGGYCLH